MSKPKYLFYDTCFYIDLFNDKVSEREMKNVEGPSLIIGHSIVLMELYQGAHLTRERAIIEELAKTLTLIGPTVQNYLDTGNILRKMTEKNSRAFGHLYEMQNDILLALSAVEQDSYVITRNKKDFEKIRHFCPVNVIYY